MTSVEVTSLAVMLLAVFCGLTAAAFLVGQRPSFWVGAIIAVFMRAWPTIMAVFMRAWPTIMAYLFKRMTPEQEAEHHQATRRAQEWDHLRKRPRDR